MRKKLDIKKSSITQEILLSLLKTGALLTVALFAPNAIKVFKNFNKDDPWSKYYPSSIDRLTGKLYRKGFVTIKYDGVQPVVKITKNGRTELLKYDLEKLKPLKMKRWDGRWRIVVFDIPEKSRNTRDFIRKKLEEMGFYQYQESIFVCPYRCQKEIEYLREVLKVPHAVKYLRADVIENEDELKDIFNIRD